jgi:hypothetical protein
LVVAALLVALCAAAKQEPENDPSWKINYKSWRQRDTVSLEEWRKNIPPPRSTLPPQTWADMDIHQRRSHFSTCIKHEAVSLTQRIPSYKSPDLMDVQRVCITVTHVLRSSQALRYHTFHLLGSNTSSAACTAMVDRTSEALFRFWPLQDQYFANSVHKCLPAA